MTTHQFTVERDPIGPHRHGYRAVEDGTGTLIALPVGGGISSTGAYPEIERHLENQGLETAHVYTPRLGDTHSFDPEAGFYIWTFKTGGCSITVRDPPRVGAEAVVTFAGN